MISKALCVDAQKLWRWYRDSISGFTDHATQEEHYQNDVEITIGRGKELIRVPILKPENIGKNMAIDEKMIGEDMHTILSNRDTGKIAMLVRSIRAHEIQKAIASVGDRVVVVETMTRDMSPTYARFGEEVFYNASQIADKFHIIKDLLETSQAVRVRYRQEALREKRLKYEAYKKQEALRKKQCEAEGKQYNPKRFSYKEDTLKNGDTVMEALARSRYLLFKFKSDWTLKQEKRAMALFERFPEIEKAYELACEFRNWMKKSNVGKDISVLKKDIYAWFQKVEDSAIEELLNFKSMIERNLLVVLNYFKFNATNAIAENINSRIQRFIMINQGTRDREFFYFRMAKYFT